VFLAPALVLAPVLLDDVVGATGHDDAVCVVYLYVLSVLQRLDDGCRQAAKDVV